MLSSPYRAPSWSWASADGVIRQLFPDPTPNGMKGYRLCIEVAVAHVEPLNSRDELGGVADGWIRILSCGLLRVERSSSMTWENNIVVEFNAPESQRVVEESGADKKGNSDLELDAVWDWPEILGQDGGRFYLPVWLNTTPYGQDKNIRRAGGLILAAPDTKRKFGLAQWKDVYRRVGRATLEHELYNSIIIVGTTPKKLAFLQAHHHGPHEKKNKTIFLV